MKSENKALDMNLRKTWRTLGNKQHSCKNVLQIMTKKLCYYEAKTRNLEADKAKEIEPYPSVLLKLGIFWILIHFCLEGSNLY